MATFCKLIYFTYIWTSMYIQGGPTAMCNVSYSLKMQQQLFASLARQELLFAFRIRLEKSRNFWPYIGPQKCLWNEKYLTKLDNLGAILLLEKCSITWCGCFLHQDRRSRWFRFFLGTTLYSSDTRVLYFFKTVLPRC